MDNGHQWFTTHLDHLIGDMSLSIGLLYSLDTSGLKTFAYFSLSVPCPFHTLNIDIDIDSVSKSISQRGHGFVGRGLGIEIVYILENVGYTLGTKS